MLDDTRMVDRDAGQRLNDRIHGQVCNVGDMSKRM